MSDSKIFFFRVYTWTAKHSYPLNTVKETVIYNDHLIPWKLWKTLVITAKFDPPCRDYCVNYHAEDCRLQIKFSSYIIQS